MKTPKTGGPNIAKGTPVKRRLLDSLEDGEEVDFIKWTDEDRITKMKEQIECCVIGEAAVVEKIKAYCTHSSVTVALKLKKRKFAADQEKVNKVMMVMFKTISDKMDSMGGDKPFSIDSF